MFSKTLVAGAILVSITATACSAKHDLMQERQRSTPPQNAQDVGVVLEGADSVQVNAILAAHPQAKVRVLNTEHGMYEIFNVDEAQVRQEFSGIAARNEFFKLSEDDKLETFAMTAPAGLQLGSLATCTSGPNAPTAVMTAESPSTQITTVELGATVRLNGAKSTPVPGDSTPLKMAYSVVFPSAASAQQKVVDGQVLEFKPDTLGLHRIYLVVQGADGTCSMDQIRFIVTVNRPYNGPTGAPLKADLTKFKHLGMVHAQEAWAIGKGDGVVIAILDTGVNYNHPSLAPNILVNDGEIPANQIDDDKNGFIDDYVGYDFVNSDGYPYDDDSHGTHVAGLAAAKQFGLAPNAKILAVKVLSSIGGDSGSIAAGIRYAVDRHANIINMSLGTSGPLPHPLLVRAVAYANQKGVILVTAAGNGDPATGLGYSIDQIPVWPASLKSDNLVTVTAYDTLNVLSTYSNFGPTSVHVVAPGGTRADPMVSCAFENPRGTLLIGFDGTSMASPVVAGIIADVWSKSPGLSVQDVKDILLQSGPAFDDLKPITVSGRHLDALSALQSATTKNVLF